MDGFRPCKFASGCGYEVCVPEFCDAYDPEIITNADEIRAMTDEELAAYLTKLIVNYTSALYDGEYTPSDEAVCKITDELLRQLQQPCEDSPTGQKG